MHFVVDGIFLGLILFYLYLFYPFFSTLALATILICQIKEFVKQYSFFLLSKEQLVLGPIQIYISLPLHFFLLFY